MEEQRFRLRTAERTWTAADLPVLTASISLPEPVDEKNRAMRKIGWFYRLEERAYLRYCQTMLFPRAAALCRQALETSAPLPRCAAALNCRVTCDGGGLWSLTADMREQFGGHSRTLRRSDTSAAVGVFPAAVSGASAPAGTGRGGNFPAGRGGRRPLSRGLAAGAAPRVQPGELLSHAGGTVLLLADAVHRPLGGGDPHVSRPLRRVLPPAGAFASKAYKTPERFAVNLSGEKAADAGIR